MYNPPCIRIIKISKTLSKIRDFSSKNLKLATLLMFYAQSLNSMLKSLVPLPTNKRSCRVKKKISIKFYQRALTITFFGDF